MNAKKAVTVLGINRATWELRNIAKALKSLSFLNTPEETERLVAAEWALKHPTKFFAECKARREAPR